MVQKKIEINFKLSDINSSSKPKVVLLHCTSDYPTNLKNVNLKAMIKMQQRYNLDIGYSIIHLIQ